MGIIQPGVRPHKAVQTLWKIFELSTNMKTACEPCGRCSNFRQLSKYIYSINNKEFLNNCKTINESGNDVRDVLIACSRAMVNQLQA